MFVYSLLRNRTADLKQFERFSRREVLSLVLSLALLQVKPIQSCKALDRVELLSARTAISVQEIRRNSVTQFVSHVFPPSGEKACSQRADEAVMCDHVTRTRIVFPRSVSSA